MAIQVRRVVTGHDAKGRAGVKIDEVSKNITSNRPGATACVVWTTESFPVNNTGDADEGLREVGTTLKNGTVFRVIEFAPGVAPRNHRTDSIDYAVVVSGEIDMETRGLGRSFECRRRARAARNGPQLGQSRHQALCDGFHPHRRQACGGRREGPKCRRVVRLPGEQR